MSVYVIGAIALAWYGLGCVGWAMMRRGFLNKYEAWGWGDKIFAPIAATLGPLFMLMAWGIHGRHCFPKPPKAN